MFATPDIAKHARMTASRHNIVSSTIDTHRHLLQPPLDDLPLTLLSSLTTASYRGFCRRLTRTIIITLNLLNGHNFLDKFNKILIRFKQHSKLTLALIGKLVEVQIVLRSTGFKKQTTLASLIYFHHKQ